MSGAEQRSFEPAQSFPVSVLRFRLHLASITGANLSQISIRVDPGGVVVVEVKLDGVVPHRCCASDLNDILAMNRKRIERDLYRWRRVAAGGTRATLAQIRVGIDRFVSVGPFDEHATWSGQLDTSGGNVHKTSDFEG